MKTHTNYTLRGGLKMTKITSSKHKSTKALPTTNLLINEDKEQPDPEGDARVYRESVMHSVIVTTDSDDHSLRSPS